jgi:hypothetical protein
VRKDEVVVVDDDRTEYRKGQGSVLQEQGAHQIQSNTNYPSVLQGSWRGANNHNVVIWQNKVHRDSFAGKINKNDLNVCGRIASKRLDCLAILLLNHGTVEHMPNRTVMLKLQ